MPVSELILAAALALHIAACALLCGAAVVCGWIAPLPIRRLAWATFAAILVTGIVLLWLQAAAMGSGDPVADIATVLQYTRFGHAWLLRIGLCLVACLLLAGFGRRGARAASLPALLGGGTLALTGHPMASGDPAFAAVGLVHVMAGLLWVGSLPPLWLALPTHGAAAARRFAWLGGPCVALVAGTALVQAWLLAGPAAGLFGSPYGLALLVKAGLFLSLCAAAATNFWRRTPALDRAAPGSLHTLRRSVAIETALGAAVVVAAAVLSRGAPGTHLQAVSPFAWRPSLTAVSQPERLDPRRRTHAGDSHAPQSA